MEGFKVGADRQLLPVLQYDDDTLVMCVQKESLSSNWGVSWSGLKLSMVYMLTYQSLVCFS